MLHYHWQQQRWWWWQLPFSQLPLLQETHKQTGFRSQHEVSQFGFVGTGHCFLLAATAATSEAQGQRRTNTKLATQPDRSATTTTSSVLPEWIRPPVYTPAAVGPKVRQLVLPVVAMAATAAQGLPCDRRELVVVPPPV
jgi:hypothetical protein